MMLEHISPEVIIHILHYSEYPTILRFAATCKAYYALVAQSTSLQLHIELESNGLELVKGSFKRDATYSVILEDLRRFRDAWLNLKIDHPIVRPLGSPDMLLWELREGFYVKGFSRSGGNHADTLQFIPLDAKSPDPPPLAFHFSFNEFTVDPAQGLVAVLSRDNDLQSTIHIQLCSSTTGLAHPLAQYPKLTIEFDSGRRVSVSHFALEIMGHLLLTRVSRNPTHVYEVLIWNWKSGLFLTRISSNMGICDTFFLDRQHLVLQAATRSSQLQTHLDTLALLVYVIPDSNPTYNASSHQYLKVADLLVSQPILRLAFPQINNAFTVSVNGFILHSDPVPGRILYAKSAAFSCSYATTLGMAFSFRSVNRGWDEPPYYRVFVDGRFLLDQIHTNANVHGETRVLPWASWGIYATRWFISSFAPDHWVSWMSGSKFLMASPDPPYHCVFDFSVIQGRPTEPQTKGCGHEMGVKWLESDIHRIAEGPMPGNGLTSITVGVGSPNVFCRDAGLAFDELIESRLPYRLAFRRLTNMNHEGLQIVGDCMVGVNTWGPGSESITIYKLEGETASGEIQLSRDLALLSCA
ncbi:unnamed protein product [Rhizoctonia solani]|uniref:F-box domain-containing protein n=1 Tax=Rhizoctonia solani TaxID=456999 RepID=A0A8H3GE16_9AGAM|nr:unnamed protein product [Rhizoctonia solani]